MLRINNIIPVFALCLLTACLLSASALHPFAVPANAAAPKQSDVDVYRTLIKHDLRLAAAGYRIAAANAAYCKAKVRNPGWVIHDIAQYPYADIAKATFVFKQPIHIAAVVPGGPADKAGIRGDDGFTGLDDAGIYWPAMPLGKTGYERMASFKQLLGEKFDEKTPLAIRISRGRGDVNTVITAPPICASDFQIVTEAGINAGADGKIVSVSFDLAEYAYNDNDLAAVVAHEMAHNILGHAEWLKSVKGKPGPYGKVSNAALKTETEADQLSIWLLGNAGYDIDTAIAFFQKLGNRPGRMFIIDPNHLPWKERIIIMRKEASRYAAAAKTNGKAPPPLLVK
jgi:beta-barrel assembly-enhancing protease